MSRLRKQDLILEQHRDRHSVEHREQQTVTPPPSQVYRFRFVSGSDDHVVARMYDGSDLSDETFNIAMDPQLRKSVVGTGYTYSDFQNRERNSDEQVEAIEPGQFANICRGAAESCTDQEMPRILKGHGHRRRSSDMGQLAASYNETYAVGLTAHSLCYFPVGIRK